MVKITAKHIGNGYDQFLNYRRIPEKKCDEPECFSEM